MIASILKKWLVKPRFHTRSALQAIGDNIISVCAGTTCIGGSAGIKIVEGADTAPAEKGY